MRRNTGFGRLDTSSAQQEQFDGGLGPSWILLRSGKQDPVQLVAKVRGIMIGPSSWIRSRYDSRTTTPPPAPPPTSVVKQGNDETLRSVP